MESRMMLFTEQRGMYSTKPKKGIDITQKNSWEKVSHKLKNQGRVNMGETDT
jgi:hypothetical protein